MCDPYVDIELAREYVADARVLLEMGGKYGWNGEFESCDNLLKLVLEILDGDVSNVYSE